MAVKALSTPSTIAESTTSILDRLSFEFQIAWGKANFLQQAAQKLRYLVYCIENSFEDPSDHPNEMERDEFDSHSVHSVLIHRETGATVGTTRLVLPKPDNLERSFPMQYVSNHPILRGSQRLPLHSTAEVSRFAVSRTVSRQVSASGSTTNPAGHCSPLMRLGLLQALVRMSAHHGITHWCAVMEPQLIRMLIAMGIHAEPIGSPIQYHGLRQPCICNIKRSLRRMQRERPAFWEALTVGGEFYGAS